MKVNRTRLVVALAWVFSIVIANYVGGVVGFSQGYSTSLVLSASETLHTVTTLRQLRAGKTADAIESLEIHLDSQIALNVFGDHDYRSPYNLFLRFVFGNKPVEGNAWSLSKVLEYRDTFPPVVGGQLLKQKLELYRGADNPHGQPEADAPNNDDET